MPTRQTAAQKREAERQALRDESAEFLAGLGYVFTIPDPLLQRDIETFYSARAKWTPEREVVTNPERNGAVARAVAEIGWVEGLTPDEVDNCLPAAVTWIADGVMTAVARAFLIPKN